MHPYLAFLAGPVNAERGNLFDSAHPFVYLGSSSETSEYQIRPVQIIKVSMVQMIL